MKTMYKGVNNSPETVLTAAISASATTIPLQSISGLPAAPNLVTIGTDDDAEVVLYNTISGQSLVGCTRGFGGTEAKSWQQGETVARCYTKYDHDTFIENILELQGDVKRYGVQFSGSASRGTRLYDAVGLSAAVGTDEETAVNDFDFIMPWAGMRRCNTALVNGERVATFFEGEVGFDNVNKDVFVYVPLFYYYRSADDNTHVVSSSPLAGYRAPSKFRRADGTLRDFVFLPAYTAGVDASGVPVSRPGYWPHCISLSAFMTLCKSKHTSGDLDADIWIEGTKDEEIIRILLDIEFATRDHQTVMQGASSMRYAADVVTEGGTNECTVPAACAAALVVGQAIAIGTADKGNQIATNVTVTAIDTATNNRRNETFLLAFDSKPMAIAGPRAKAPLIRDLDAAAAALTRENPLYAADYTRDFLTKTSHLTLHFSPEETALIESLPPLRVVLPETLQTKDIVRELIETAAKDSGLRVTLLSAADVEAARLMISAGTADIMPAYYTSQSDTTDAYYTMPLFSQEFVLTFQ